MLKKKVVILLLSMMLFIGVFLYGAFQNIDKPFKEDEKPETSQKTEMILSNVWIISGEKSEITYFNEKETATVETAMELSETIENLEFVTPDVLSFSL